MRRAVDEHGFTLVEACIAMSLLVLAATAAAQLFGVAIASTQVARLQTSTVVLANQKLEALRALSWPEPALSPTVADALDSNMPGSVEHLSARGVVVGTDLAPPPTARFIRRWSIRALPEDPANALIVQVLVTTPEVEQRALLPRRRMAGDALVTTILARLR
jgi:type II secretory pathway pseudopilin PulG